MEQKVEIDLKEIFGAIMRRILIIAVIAVVCAGLVYGYTAYFITPQYRATVSIYVNNSSNQSQVGISSSDLTTAQKLVNTYMNILMSNRVLEKVIEETGLELTTVEVRKMLEAKSMNGTEMFEVNVSNSDPEKAAKIANAIASVAPGEIAEIVVGSSTKIVDYAKVPEAPYTPNKLRNAVLGGFAGVLLAGLVIALQVVLDVRIRDEHDLRGISKAPVLGVIPNFETEETDGYEYQTKRPKQVSKKPAVSKGAEK